MLNIFNYSRRHSSVVRVGSLLMGGDNAIRVQSMTTTRTDDTEACVAQAKRIIDAGGELVRLTTQGVREAENMRNIGQRLKADGYTQPLCADVHFNPRVADVAATCCEKVRVNPGNYVDPARKFIRHTYTDEEYAEELRKLDLRFTAFLRICAEHKTAIRIGVNHGSLSDRIRNRYGDTPEGIVESCMEFLRICKREKFDDVVISIKSSNTVVMIRSMRLLVATMEREGMSYPLHLGVTEAGEGEDGRIKSAVGIGTLLADGIGDTVRVSLSEEPEAEIPVAHHLVDYVTARKGHVYIPAEPYDGFDWLRPLRRRTHVVGNIGGDNVPVVICTGDADGADYIYDMQPTHTGDLTARRMPSLIDYNRYDGTDGTYPIFPHNAMPLLSMVKADMKFLVVQYGVDEEELTACLRHHPEVVVVATSTHQNRVGELRAMAHLLTRYNLTNPLVFALTYRHNHSAQSDFQIESAADAGPLMTDGLCDGLWLMNDGDITADTICQTAFAILQAGRLRTVKTEYISCPGCGRTLYDLRGTIAKIKAATSHLKGLKIGIMGCIVNGPGEMADADYGYVGAGPGKVSLYRRQECVEHNIAEDEAVEHLLKLIESDGQKGSVAAQG